MPRLILQNSNYIDVLTAQLIENQVIVAKDQRIVWIGEASSFEKEKDDILIDVTGKIVLPGLIDCHVHLGLTATIDMYAETMRTNDELYPYLGLKHAQDHLKSGFTTIREAGNFRANPRWGASLKHIFNENIFAGPRLLFASDIIVQKGNQALIGPGDLIYGSRTKNVLVSGRDEVINAVRIRKENGADLIKTTTTGGVLHGQDSSIDRSLWREEELLAMVDEAHRLGLHCAAHAHGAGGILKAVDAGFDTIEHASFITEEIAEVVIQKGIYIVPTHNAGHGLQDPVTYNVMPPEIKTKIDDTMVAMLSNHKMAFEKGVNIALGTDAGTPNNPHGTTARELTRMVTELGMSPMQAIQCATIESAKAIKISKETGSIEVGKYADFVVLNGNPLDNIALIEHKINLEYVIKDGILMARQGKLM